MSNQSGEKSSDYFLNFEEYPTIKHAQEEIKEEKIPGKGAVHIRTGIYSDTEITLLLDLVLPREQEEWMNAYMKAHDFLKSLEIISFCDGPDIFYYVRAIKINAADRYSETAGDFKVSISCKPGIYLLSGTEELSIREFDGINKYSVCCPVYKISGEGVCALTVNGKTVTVNVAQTMIIDTDRMIAYREDSGEIMNTSITGNYEDLYLYSGENTISATEGFEISLVPNWRIL